MSLSLTPRDFAKSASTQFASFLHAYRECSQELQAVVDEMTEIIVDPASTPEEIDHASDAIAECLCPGLIVDMQESHARMLRTPEFKRAAQEIEIEEAAFAKRLRELMEERGITQQQLAEATSVTQPAISNLLNRQCRPQQKTIARLATALGVAPETLWPPQPD